MRLNSSISVVVMAKPPVAGRVKTRLIGRGPGCLTAEQAAAAHEAMARCVMQRLQGVANWRGQAQLVLALAGVSDEPGPAAGALAPPAGWRVIDQGQGDLGERLRHVWQTLGGGPIVFFGTDSPDVPGPMLEAIPAALASAEVAVGPVEDGGYWAIGAVRYLPPLFTDIDWGTPRVYHQTLEAARRAGAAVHVLPRWHDVDEPGDLVELRRRLGEADEPALRQLAQRLTSILTPTPGTPEQPPEQHRNNPPELPA